MVSRNSKPYGIGCQVARALLATSDILYLLDNKEEYLTGIVEVLTPEIARVQKQIEEKQKRS